MNASLIQDFNRICGPANFIFNAEAKGIEPPTVLRLLPIFKTGSSSIRTTSIWLSHQGSNLNYSDPKSDMLPLHHETVFVVLEGFEPSPNDPESLMLPLHYRTILHFLSPYSANRMAH